MPRALTTVPGGLYPMMSAAFEIDEYRMMAGWPVPVPTHDIRIEVNANAAGLVLGERESPLAVVTEANLRWVADANYFDETAARWDPVAGELPWTAAPTSLPTLITDYEYVLDDEVFTSMVALNFDSDTGDHMIANLDSLMGGTSGYTVLMVLSPNSVYGNGDYTEAGLWSSEESENWARFTVRSQALTMTTDEVRATRGPELGDVLQGTAPGYLALVVGRPQTRLYIATGPSNISVKAFRSGKSPVPLSTHFSLGSAPPTSIATMDMALFDLSVYGNLLNTAQIRDEIATLAQVYGGDT